MIKGIIYVGLGGAIGSILRYLVNIFLSEYCRKYLFLSTFAVNITGCFLIGVLSGISLKYGLIGNDKMLFYTTGFCGGFTTFSAFMYENLLLIKDGDIFLFLCYTILSVLAGILACFAGLKILI